MPQRLAGLSFIAVSLLHLVAQLVAPDTAWAGGTQVLLMPALALVLLLSTAAPRPRVVRWALVALGCSWLGDSLPRLLDADAGFLAMIGCFWLAQVAWILAFWPWRDRSVLTRPAALAPYALAAAGLAAWCGASAGPLLAPVVLYAVVLTAMAVLATGLGRVAGVGGALFMASDSLIALHAFVGLDLPGQGFWVMLTYVLAQALLVGAVAREAGRAAPRRGGRVASAA